MSTKTTKEILQSTLDPISAVLLVEHDRLASLYEHNVAMGDQLFAAYLTVVSLAVALLVGVKELVPQYDSLLLFELAILIIISVVGMITFRRLIDRRIRSIEYLRAINRIHHYFVEIEPKSQQYFYWPACDDCPPMRAKGTVLEGLRDIVAVLNSVFLGFVISMMARTWFPELHSLALVLIGIVVGGLIWLMEHKFSETALKHAEQEINEHILFPQPK